MVTLIGFSVLTLTAGTGTAVASAGPFDNMYPTSNAEWPCLDYGVGGNFCRTDNATLTVWLQGSLTAAAKSTVKGRLSSVVSPTDIAVSYPSSASYAGSAETDIIYQQSGSGMSGTTIGMTWCDDAAAGVCDQAYVRFRYDSIDSELACHETGHALGLTHGTDASPRVGNANSSLGCMEKPDSGNRTTFGTWQTTEINDTY
ncbi:hypothetical protein [Streptomyces sp. NPDC086182]|jgi:hypothetical protein|uniref:hypothetical protein n=1 Tax=Streptomyces sp. NPDC086182 TaxID=3155058 RepID=UPI00342512E3